MLPAMIGGPDIKNFERLGHTESADANNTRYRIWSPSVDAGNHITNYSVMAVTWRDEKDGENGCECKSRLDLHLISAGICL